MSSGAQIRGYGAAGPCKAVNQALNECLVADARVYMRRASLFGRAHYRM